MDKLDLLMALRNNPWIFSWRWKLLEEPGLHRRVVRFGDDVVIEGFPRSANSFATHAFVRAQGKHVTVANHFHSPAQFALAKRYGVPAMLVIRQPRGAVLSHMLFHTAPVRESLRKYIGFHKPLLGLRDYFVVAPFDEVTTNFDVSIDRLNSRFGTKFRRFGHTSANAADLMRYIEEIRQTKEAVIPELAGDPMKKTTPSLDKNRELAKLESQFDDPKNVHLVEQAQRIYTELANI